MEKVVIFACKLVIWCLFAAAGGYAALLMLSVACPPDIRPPFIECILVGSVMGLAAGVVFAEQLMSRKKPDYSDAARFGAVVWMGVAVITYSCVLAYQFVHKEHPRLHLLALLAVMAFALVAGYISGLASCVVASRIRRALRVDVSD